MRRLRPGHPQSGTNDMEPDRDECPSTPSPPRRREGGASLSGRRIVVTRPAQQADKLIGLIEAHGGIAVPFPVLAIFDAADPRPLQAAARDIDTYAIAIFVSPNAAQKALAAITARRPWPERVVAAAMGETSARAIARFGVARILTPSGGRFDSEALLERPEFQSEAIQGRRVAIFRGDSGRELLGETLEARGALVTRIPCYRRGRPDIDAAPLRALLAQGKADALTVTSSEGLRNLVTMVGAASEAALKATPLFVAHQRIAEEAGRMGFAETIVTAAGDAGLLAGLTAYFGSMRKDR